MRVTIWLVVLSIALVVCAFFAKRSKKSIANDVFLMLVSLLPPMVGNLFIILSEDWLISRIGSYIYFIGLDWTIITLLRFTCDYCKINYAHTKLHIVVSALIAVDIAQLLLNPILGHAFTTIPITVEGATYYSLVPFAGQAFHRVVVYGVFFASIGVFAYKTITSSRIYVERYLVILIVMIITGAWESFYIFSGSPIDRSMIGFGMFGLLIFYFSLFYKPMRLLDRMLVRVVSNLDVAVFFFDTTGLCIYANDLGRRMVGLGEADTIAENATETIGKAIGGWPNLYNQNWTEHRYIGEGENRRFLELDMKQLFDGQGRHVGASLAVRDRTEEQQKLQHEKHLATHDSLTGLFNQRFLYEEGRRLIDENPGIDFRVVAVDVKDFKLVNDIYSKEVGDRLLCSIADDMRRYASPHEVYGRISGDKFGLVLPVDEFQVDNVEAIMLDYDFSEHGINHPVIIHLGVYDVVDRDLELPVMFDRAFMAVKSIKKDYRRRIAYYDDAMRENAIWNQKISSELDNAIATGQVQPYLQPMVNDEGEVEGAEVLVRWIHPEEGFLSPASFIPYFEENGRIAQLDLHIWECACRILQEWQRKGIDLFLSVNISPKDFYFLDVHEAIKNLVAKYGIDPAKLRLEITETVMMTDIANRLRIIEGLRRDGFLVEMDDFGSGYSSLNMLKDIPVDVLKIDMMFLYKTKDQQRAQTILQTIINLSGQLGMPSVTEGVETAEQLAMLTDMGCRMFQGYFFAKPMPVQEFEESYCRAA